MEEGKKIYIGNLEYGVTKDDLSSFISEKGINVREITIIMDKFTGKPKGFGFAEFGTEEEAQQAIDSLNGQELKGRTLKVNKAQKMKPRREGGFDQGSRGESFDRGGGRGEDRY